MSYDDPPPPPPQYGAPHAAVRRRTQQEGRSGRWSRHRRPALLRDLLSGSSRSSWAVRRKREIAGPVQGGDGLAKAGFILGIIGVALASS